MLFSTWDRYGRSRIIFDGKFLPKRRKKVQAQLFVGVLQQFTWRKNAEIGEKRKNESKIQCLNRGADEMGPR